MALNNPSENDQKTTKTKPYSGTHVEAQGSSSGAAAHESGYTYEHATESILWALGVNFVITLLKLGAWFLTRSPSMLSESLHTLGDTINSVALLIGLRLSNREPDPSHPFGYGLEASVWAMPACFLLFAFSGLAIYEGWERLVHGVEHVEVQSFLSMDPYYLAVGILIISIVLEIVAVQKASKAVLEEFGLASDGGFFKALGHIKQVIGPTTRFVFYEDTIALVGSSLALIAITMSHFSQANHWLAPEYAHWPDAIVSILIGLMLMGMAIYLFIHNRTILTGTSASPQTEQEISRLVTDIYEVSEIHDLVVIDRGPGGLSVHLDVEVEPDMPVKDVDDLTEKIKEKLTTRIKNVNKSQINIEVLADETETEWEDQFLQLIQQGRTDSVLKLRDEQMLKNVYDFTQETVESVMVPRTDVIAIENTTVISEVAEIIIESGHSRLPVYEETMDDILGIIHTRDIFEQLKLGNMDASIQNLIREVSIYPENKPISDLLEDFKRKKLQLAIVMDEHGGFAGIVTIEDLMEEIVGEIWDEHDEEDLEIVYLSKTEVLVNGKCDITDINEALGQNIPDDEFTTIAGFVFGELGREPKANDAVSFEDLEIKVFAVEGVRITRLKITSSIPFLVKETNEKTEV